jgi:hypothetical protein
MVYKIYGLSNNDIKLIESLEWTKELNKLYEANQNGVKEADYLEYFNLREFYEWILSLKPKDVKEIEISERGLRNVIQKIRKGNGLKNRSKIIKILFEKYLNKGD